jgi:hypothetical protein
MESLTHLLKVNHFHEDFLSLSLKKQVTLVYGLARLFLVEQLFQDLEQIM